MEVKLITHPFEPIYDKRAESLILGSFPSVKSRENEFYYGHKQNRFWKVLSAVFECPEPQTTQEKTAMLLENKIALWDVAQVCSVEASADSSIKNVVPNDIGKILESTKIERIFTNGKTAEKLYNRLVLPQTGLLATPLPSTSPANAAFSLDKLISEWSKIRNI